MGRRRSPRRHTVHTKNPRYRVSQYGRGLGIIAVHQSQVIGQPQPKAIDGKDVWPVKVIEKGKDWVDYVRSDGLAIRCWDFSDKYLLLRRAPKGLWLWIPEKATKDGVSARPSEIKTYRGASYFPTQKSAMRYARDNGLPTERIIAYERGWAIQKYPSGPYYNTKEKQWM